MAYTPPTAPLVANFTRVYTPPTAPLSANFANGSDQYLFPAGIGSLAMGAPVAVYTQYGVVTGADYVLFGAHNVAYPPEPPSTQTITATGIASSVVSAPMIDNYLREIIAGDIASLSMPSPGIGDRVRTLVPPWIASMQFGVAMLGRARSVEPAGFDAAIFGEVEAKDNRQTVDTEGLFGEVGIPAIGYRVRPLGVGLINVSDEFRIGAPLIRNDRQFIKPEYVAEHWHDSVVGHATITNKNREIDLVLNSVRPPFRQVSYGASIDNTARLIGAESFDPLGFGTHQAADFIRSFGMEGWDSFGSDRYAVVFNAAEVIAPNGFIGDSFGLANLQNTRRTLPPTLVGETSLFGTAFIADAVRTLTPWGDFVAYPMSETHTIDYVNRELAPMSLDWPFSGTAFGIAQMDIMDRRLRTPGILSKPSVFGESRIDNVVRQVYPYWDSALFTLFGAGQIINRTAVYEVEGILSGVVNKPTIADRKQHLGAPGFAAQRFSIPTIRNELPDPPPTQTVFDAGQSYMVVGIPTVTANSLFPEWAEGTLFGVTRIASNTISPDGIQPFFNPDTGTQFGLPALNDNQHVSPLGFFYSDVGRPSMSPLTIWAPEDAPEQARQNHPSPFPPHVIDAYVDKEITATISNKNRSIALSGFESELFTIDHRVSRDPETIFNQGLNSLKIGVPEIRNANELKPSSISTLNFGDAIVQHYIPYDGIVAPRWFNSLEMGSTEISARDRAIELDSIGVTESFGIHTVQRPHPPIELTGMYANLFGEGMVSHRIRAYPMEGFDSFLCTFRPGEFATRMRVYRRNYIGPPSLGDTVVFGQTEIGPLPVGVIKPFGVESWPMQIYHGIFHA